jgi:hypothetical protein
MSGLSASPARKAIMSEFGQTSIHFHKPLYEYEKIWAYVTLLDQRAAADLRGEYPTKTQEASNSDAFKTSRLTRG